MAGPPSRERCEPRARPTLARRARLRPHRGRAGSPVCSRRPEEEGGGHPRDPCSSTTAIPPWPAGSALTARTDRRRRDPRERQKWGLFSVSVEGYSAHPTFPIVCRESEFAMADSEVTTILTADEVDQPTRLR